MFPGWEASPLKVNTHPTPPPPPTVTITSQAFPDTHSCPRMEGGTGRQSVLLDTKCY